MSETAITELNEPLFVTDSEDDSDSFYDSESDSDPDKPEININNSIYNTLYDVKDKLTSKEYKDLTEGVFKIQKQLKPNNTFKCNLHIIKPVIGREKCQDKKCNIIHYHIDTHKFLVECHLPKDFAVHIAIKIKLNDIYSLYGDEIEYVKCIDNDDKFLFEFDEVDFNDNLKNDKNNMYIVSNSVDIFRIDIVG